MATRIHRLRVLAEILRCAWGGLAFLSVPVLITELQRAASSAPGMAAACRIFICSAVTCMYLCRWVIGNFRYLTATWDTRPSWVSLTAKEPRFWREVILRFLCDFILMAGHGTLLCWMAACVSDLPQFLTALLWLLVSDLFWLAYNASVWPCWTLLFVDFAHQLLRGKRYWIRVSKRTTWIDDYAPRKWTWTNLATAAALLTLRNLARMFGFDETLVSLIAVVLITAANSYVDFRETQFGLASLS